MDKDQDVAITGMGIVNACGNGVSTFRDALFYGRNYFSLSTRYPMLSFPVIGAFIQDDNLAETLRNFSHLIGADRQQNFAKLINYSPRPIQIALIAAFEAAHQAAIFHQETDPNRTGLIVGAQNATGNYQYALMDEFSKNPEYLSPTFALHFMDTDYVGIMSEAFGFKGEGFSVGGASATGNVALLKAYQLIRDGWQDACLVVGALADLSPLELQGFYNLGALGGFNFAKTPNKASRPFDSAHGGFIYGQAAACIFLESLRSAKNRQVPILGYLRGGALRLYGTHLSNPSLQSEIDCMREAMKIAKVNSENIDYINTHGTSAPLGDEVELKAIQAIAGDKRILINSTKSIIGHCLWSAGVVEAIATVIQMQEKFIHPTLNLDNPIANYAGFVTKKSIQHEIHLALSNSFGFGGINSTLVFADHP